MKIVPFAGALWLAACTVPVGPTSAPGLAPIEPGKGQIVVSWQPLAAKTALASGWAASVADAYELLVVGPAGNRAYGLSGSGTQAFSVDPATYRVLVLAGTKRSSGSSTALLVGSALSEGVVVTAGARTPVTLTLKPIDVGWETGGAAYWKDPWTVRALGASRNPRVGMSLAGASTTQRPRFRSTDLFNGYKETTVSGTPDAWRAEATGTVPTGGTGFAVDLVGAGLVFAGGDDQWTPTAGVTAFTWIWPSRPDLADTHPLATITSLGVSCGPAPTGVDVSLAWE